jgi:hypothetical protein
MVSSVKKLDDFQGVNWTSHNGGGPVAADTTLCVRAVEVKKST